MKLSEIIHRANTQNLEDAYIGEIAEREFDIYGIPWIENCRLKFCHLKTILDTDSWVGTRLYFLDDKFVAISEQRGRKCKEDFIWSSKESFDYVYNYILSLKEVPYQFIEFISEDIVIPEYFKLTHSCEIITGKHKCYYQGQEVEISRERQNNSKVNIISADGECLSVLVSDLDFRIDII